MPEADAWIGELVSFSNNYMPGYNTALGLAALGGMSAINPFFNRRYQRPTAIVPVSKTAIHDAQIANLRRMINLNKQQISNFGWGNSITVPASTNFLNTDLNITAALTGSTDYPKTVLGDQFVNKSLKTRIDGSTLTTVRVVLYWTQDPGNGWSPSAITDIPDPASYTVVYDSLMFPNFTGHINGTVKQFFANLKNRRTLYNYSVSTIKKGELRMSIQCKNSLTSAVTLSYSHRLFYANK